MSCPGLSKEEQIKKAAIKIFLEKGFDGTTTRDIAKEAGVNSALMNYYFRSKEKLFSTIFEEMLKLSFQSTIDIFNKPISLKEKILEKIEHDFRMFKDNSFLSVFIINELQRNPDRVFDSIQPTMLLKNSLFEQQLNEAIKTGEMRAIELKHLMLLLISNVQFIFQNKVMTRQIWKMDENDFNTFAEKHKALVKEMIINYLFEPVEIAA